MTKRMVQIKPAVRYSEAYKMQVVRELESGGVNMARLKRKYGIGSAYSIQRWVYKYGNGSHGKVIRVQEPEERDEREQLKRRVRGLERSLADAQLELALERQYTVLACRRAGIEDVEGFKKKAGGKVRI